MKTPGHALLGLILPLIVTVGKGYTSQGPNCYSSNGTRKDNEVSITGGTWPSVLPAGGKVGV